MKCAVHDERNTAGQCSCSEIVKALRRQLAEMATKISREERYIIGQGHTVAERSYRVGWNDAMKRAWGLAVEAQRDHTEPSLQQLYKLVEPPEYSDTCPGCIAYAHAAVDEVLAALGIELPLR